MSETAAIETILSYNVLEGLQHSKVQIDVLVDWVGGLAPDIVFYQELNNFSEEEFRELARRYGHPHAVKLPDYGYRPGISSKYELCDVERVAEGFCLGYIYARIADTHLFCLHLEPFEEELRLEEIKKILTHVGTLPEEERVMIVGDFNSLAISDQEAYSTPGFEMAFRERNPGSGMDFRVIDTMLAAGYTDAFTLFHSDFHPSFPSRKRFMPGDAGVRIDYAFLSPALKDECMSAEIVHDPITRFLSDHYPLVVKFKPRS